jgi:L-asparaginase
MSGKQVCLMYTGGTVGMQRTAHGYAPMPDFAGTLARLLGGAALPGHTLVEYPAPIDSSNATPADWQTIARDIAARYDAFDGFVVLHGTDTMAYTASALSFMLQGLRKPVIVTGSQIPLGEARTDAKQNLITALQLAAHSGLSEVGLYFNQRLLRGNRSSKISTERLAAFDSPNHPWLAEAGIGMAYNRAAWLAPAAAERFELPEYESGQILSLKFVPGMPLRLLEALLALQPRALILECYGDGNAPDRDAALLAMLSDASRRGVVLAACSQCRHGQVTLGLYATGTALARAGVVGALDTTYEALYAKLHHLFALGLAPDEVRAALGKNLAGECGA